MEKRMKLNSIRWRLPVSYAAIAFLAALALGSVMLLVLGGYYARQERDYLLVNATSLQPLVEQMLTSNPSRETLENTLKGLAFLSQTRIRILDTRGETLADSGIPDLGQLVSISGAAPDTFIFSLSLDGSAVYTGGATNIICDPPTSDCPETLPASALTVNSSPLGYGFITTESIPVDSNPARRSRQVVGLPLNNSLGTLEISQGPAYGQDIIRSVSLAWAGAGVVAVLLAALAGWYASRRFTLPVLALTHATQRMENGDLSARVGISGKNPAAEFQALAHSFNGMAQQVEGTVSTLRAFVADAAHELHTPLTALHTNLELVADETDAARQSLYLERAQEQSARLEGLVGGLLDLSRIEAAHPGPETGPLDLGGLLGEMEEQLASRAEQANRVFTLELPEEPVTVTGNPPQLRRVVTNLFENSLKFTPAGGSITIGLVRSGGQAILTVTDTGIGVPPEDLPHLFERFHRGRNVSSFPGSGLGLAITRALIRAHGGGIRAESTLGAGTNIVIELPVIG